MKTLFATLMFLAPAGAFAHGLHLHPESSHSHFVELAVLGLAALALWRFIR